VCVSVCVCVYVCVCVFVCVWLCEWKAHTLVADKANFRFCHLFYANLIALK